MSEERVDCRLIRQAMWGAWSRRAEGMSFREREREREKFIDNQIDD
jgi:hypothetical protein